MAKWIVHSKYDVRYFRKSAVIEADTEDEAYEYYIDNIWATDKDVVVDEWNIDDSDDTLEVKQVEKGG